MLSRFLSLGFRVLGGQGEELVVGEKEAACLIVGDIADDDDIDRDGFRDAGGIGGGGRLGGTRGADDRLTCIWDLDLINGGIRDAGSSRVGKACPSSFLCMRWIATANWSLLSLLSRLMSTRSL